MTAFVDAASRLISGGQVGSLVGPVVVLVVWGLGAFLSTMTIVKRKRMVAPAPTALPAGAAGTAVS